MNDRIQTVLVDNVRRLRRVARYLLVALLVAACLLCAPHSALAQKKKKEDEAPKKSYVLPYMIVIMVVSVGLMTVCRPGNRKDRPDDKKPDESE